MNISVMFSRYKLLYLKDQKKVLAWGFVISEVWRASKSITKKSMKKGLSSLLNAVIATMHSFWKKPYFVIKDLSMVKKSELKSVNIVHGNSFQRPQK